MRVMKVILSFMFVVLLFIESQVLAADLQKGLEAVQKGDFATAYAELKPLADQGNADAQNSLAWEYYLGRAVPQDSDQAVKWFTKAAEQGHVDAQYQLALLYSKDKDIPEKNTQAVKWFIRAAEQGHARAQYLLSVRYSVGNGVQQDLNEEIRWLLKSAEQGNADAQEGLRAIKKGKSYKPYEPETASDKTHEQTK